MLAMPFIVAVAFPTQFCSLQLIMETKSRTDGFGQYLFALSMVKNKSDQFSEALKQKVLNDNAKNIILSDFQLPACIVYNSRDLLFSIDNYCQKNRQNPNLFYDLNIERIRSLSQAIEIDIYHSIIPCKGFSCHDKALSFVLFLRRLPSLDTMLADYCIAMELKFLQSCLSSPDFVSEKGYHIFLKKYLRLPCVRTPEDQIDDIIKVHSNFLKETGVSYTHSFFDELNDDTRKEIAYDYLGLKKTSVHEISKAMASETEIIKRILRKGTLHFSNDINVYKNSLSLLLADSKLPKVEILFPRLIITPNYIYLKQYERLLCCQFVIANHVDTCKQFYSEKIQKYGYYHSSFTFSSTQNVIKVTLSSDRVDFGTFVLRK